VPAELASIAAADTGNGVGRGTIVAVGVLPEGVFLPADWHDALSDRQRTEFCVVDSSGRTQHLIRSGSESVRKVRCGFLSFDTLE
jgi:hypothetical protein